ncbi:hypothetical protein KAW48_10280, partial [candidate division WOR-3 bacterium]|nr:hypothetical protein [candidate division WOR-3 bacterium]
MKYLRKFTLSILLIFSISLLAEGVEKLKVSRKFSSPIQQVHPTIKKGKPLDKNTSQKRETFSSGMITSSSGVIERTFYFDQNMLSFEKERNYDIISIPNAFYLTDIGHPSLPKISVKLLIPPGATTTRIEVVSSEKITIPGEFNIFPAQPPVKISSNKEIPSFVEPDPSVYNSEKPYPSNLLSDRIHNGTKCGYRITDFFIYPLQSIPLEKTLILYTTITVRLYYEGGESSVKSITHHQKEIFGSSVKGMVLNPENIEIWAPPIVRNKGPYGDWEMVIIAPNNSAWIDSLQILADWKTKKGVPCTVKNLQDIYNAYTGSTDQWKIKQYINDMKTDSGTIWVLFGADHGTDATNSIPCRGVYVYVDASHHYTNMPSERYYEDLDNDWNYDGDSYYGEDTDGPEGNQLNWLSDVYVGRIFADNAQDAGKYVRRILKYEKDPAANYTTKALFYSDYLFGSNNGYYTTDECNNEVPSAWFKGGNGSHPGWHYAQGIDNYQSDHATIDSMNSGYGFICTASHGYYNAVMDQGSDNTITISSTDIDNWLSPGDNLGIHTGICCLSGGFDQPSDCIAEHIYDKGGIGGAWNSREGWGYTGGTMEQMTHELSNGIVWQFFVQTFSESPYHLGEAVAEDKDHFVGHIDDAYWNWCLKEYNTFGDPELPMWTAANGPDILSVTHDPTVPSVTSNFTINVKDNDNVTNIQGARVCCWCKSETSMYKKDTTNSSGNATLSINPTIVGDTMWVTVTKQNYKPYEGYAVVTGNAKPTTPTIIRIFDNAIFNAHPSYECTLSFVSTDPDNNDIQYQIHWSPDPNLSSPSSKNTGTFSSGDTVTTTILLGSTPAEAETLFYWKVRATDPGGSGNWSNWSDTRSLTMDMEVSKVYWYQVMGEQFEQGTASSITVQGDSVILNQGPSGSDTLFYWVNAGQLYYLPQPDDYDDSLFTLSFTPAHAGTLKSASFYFYYLVGSGN